MKGGPDGYVPLLPKPTNVAVEIGSKAGPWAERFLRHVPHALLFCVDPWTIDESDDLPPGVGAEEESFDKWVNRMKPWLGRRVWPLRGKSWDIVDTFKHTIDFLMIDGDHREEAVFRDLTMWVRKVRPGGLIVGHDWTGDDAKTVRAGVNAWLSTQINPPEIKSDILVPSPRRACFYFYKE